MSDEMTTHERLAAWLDGEAALYRERAQRAEAAQDWDPAVRYAGAADALVQLRDRVLRGLAAIFGRWPGDETDEEIRHGGGEMSDTTQHTPADVRERVAKIVREAMEDARRSERLNTFPQSSMWDYADRILALLRTPRGEGEAVRVPGAVERPCDCAGCHCANVGDAEEVGYADGWNACRDAMLAALRSEAQGGEERR